MIIKNSSTMNPFDTPERYRKLILESCLLSFKKIDLKGKSLACLFLTRFCTVGCPFCFFKSRPPWRKQNIEDQFSDEGIEKFIQFSKKANLGYLLISGGGEPLNQKKHILKIIEDVTADNIVLVTSGNWAQSFKAAEKYLSDIYNSSKKRLSASRVVVRVSVSEGHSIKLGVESAKNILNIFENKFANEENFILQIKAFENDKALQCLIQQFPNAKLSSIPTRLVSDNPFIIKRIPEKYLLRLESGYEITVGVSKIFHSTLKPDLNNLLNLQEAIGVVEDDVQICEEDNPAIVFNTDGTKGLDWSINFNGNICIWQNQVRDTYMNLYEDSYDKIIDTYLNDPVTYSFVHKGSRYRDNIISEINPKAVLRAKAIGLRDSTGAVLFEEEKTRLYYAIRVLQDYIEEGLIKLTSLKNWPKELSTLVRLTQEELKNLYKKSTHNIIIQQMKRPFNQDEWQDFLELIKLGHYELSKEEISKAIHFYNIHTQAQIQDLSDINPQLKDMVRRLTERLTYIKPMQANS